jgi:hypothetical protein
MRKFILISVFVLASVTAQAGQSRGLIMASNDAPGSGDRIESVQPEQAKADVKPEVAKPVAEAPKPATAASKPATVASKPVKKASRASNTGRAPNYAGDEAQARSIAARYGVSW